MSDERKANPRTVTFTIQKTAPAVTTPVAKRNLSYTGSALALVTPGSVNVGTMQYALGTATAATGPYTTSIRTRKSGWRKTTFKEEES
jgi:hypothetical protein